MRELQISTFIKPNYIVISEDMTDMGKMMLEFMGGKVIDSFRTGDYELFLLSDPMNTGGYQIALQRDGRDFMNPFDQMSPGGSLDSFVDLRNIKKTIMRWIELPETIYVSSFDEEKESKYANLLQKLKIPFTRTELGGKSMIQLNNF